MTYQLIYTPKDAPSNDRGVCMFDIEYYLTREGQNEDNWFSEISCLPCVDGLTYFLKDMSVDVNFDYDKFMEHAHQIQEIRGLLYERNNNKPKEYKEASNFHYNIFGKDVEKMLNNFCDMYGLWLNID